MSYPPLSGYYNPAAQPTTQSNDNGYSASSRNANNSTYSSPMNNVPSSTPQSNYSNSSYEWSGQTAYSDHAPAQQPSESYPSSSEYGYQRSGGYGNHAHSTITNPYSSDYYGRSSVAQSRQAGYNQNEGLTGLAYVSALESANTRSSNTGNGRTHDASASQHQNRVRSPVDNQPSYSVYPSTAPTSYPMRPQGSSSSTSSNQLAVHAAAALAGAVGRRNASNAQHHTPNAAREPPQMSHTKFTASTVSRQMTSPQSASASHSNQSDSQISHRSASQQRPVSAQSNRGVPQTGPHQASTRIASAAQSEQVNQSQTSQQRTSTGPTPRGAIQTGSIASLMSVAHEAEPSASPCSSEQNGSAPTFIDPTSIFDPYAQERERRRQAAERAAVEAKKQVEEDARRKAAEEKEAAEAAARKKSQEQADTQKKEAAAKSNAKARSKGTPAPAPAPASAAQTPQSEKERMAAELKGMMEQMKAIQSKDPSLFKELWDTMRKPGPTVAPVSVDTPSPPALPQTTPVPNRQISGAISVTTTPTQPAEEGKTPKSRNKGPRVGADGQPLFLNGYPVIVENNPEGLPDLGRFPAERRVRHSYAKKNKVSVGESVAPTNAVPAPTTPAVNAAAASTYRKPLSPPKPMTLVSTPNATPAALSQVYQTTEVDSAGRNSGSKTGSGTLWPLEKRNALTSTALRVLKAIPENQGHPITGYDLQKMLERNPSYLELCQQLEAKGLKFNRGHFARELLNSVPDLKASSQAAANGTTASGQTAAVNLGAAAIQVQNAAAVTAPAPAPLPPRPASQLPQSNPQSQPMQPLQYIQYTPAPPHGAHPQQPFGPSLGVWVQTPTPAYNAGKMYPPGKGYGPSKNVPRYSGRPEPAPGSKEAAARKRDFSELIDLTELGDDDTYMVPDKYARLNGPDSDDEVATDPFQAYHNRNQTAPNPQPAPPGAASSVGQPRRYGPGAGHQGPSLPYATDALPVSRQGGLLLAKPLNRDEALKKQFYDPKTVARDILIASGRHPSERPLNVHLAGLLGKYIELDSDVNTFEWDEIDPGGHPTPKVEVGDVPASKPRFKLGQRVLKNKKCRSGAVIDRPRGPMNTEKHAKDADPLPSKTALESSNGLTSDSPTIKQQVRRDKFTKTSSKLRQSLLASDETATPAQFDPTRPPSTPKPVMSQEPVHRKRGRPPGSKNKFPSVAGLKAQADSLKPTTDGTTIQTTPVVKDKFKCKWKKCSTVLHNLDTLRKHIGRVHRPSSTDLSRDYTCWWKKCRYLKQDEETGEWTTTKAYDRWEDWLKHIEKEHVTPIAAKWGDGPATSQIDPQTVMDNRKIYLSDQSGLETTPTLEIADNHQYPPDTLNLTELDHRTIPSYAMTSKQKTEEAAYIAFMRAHGINDKRREESREASREVLRSLAKRKELIGPGIDRGGCTLVNEEMREGFVQNPGVWRIVGADE